MARISRLSFLRGFEKNEEHYLTYTYNDIKTEWILYEGTLDYFHGENFLLKKSIFKKYFAVLISMVCGEKRETKSLLYIYSNKDNNPFKVFELKSNDQLNDRCQRMIMGKSGLFLMEFMFDKQSKNEIFGCCSVAERDTWIQRFNQAKRKLESRPLSRSISDAPNMPSAVSYGEVTKPRNISEQLNYEPFGTHKNPLTDRQSVKSLPSDLYIRSDRSRFDSVTEETDNIIECRFTWNNIFYDNRNNDYPEILMKNGQTGVFLVRPKIQQTSSNDHDHTLCVLYNGIVEKYAIRQTSTGELHLIYRKNEPCFPDIPHLCHYYTTSPLSILKDNLTKQFYLTFPYKQDDDLYE